MAEEGAGAAGDGSEGEGRASLKVEIEHFVQIQREKVDANNREEFCAEVGGGAARAAMRQLDRRVQMKVSAVDNQEGPLSRSLISSTSNKLVSPHGITLPVGIISDPQGRFIFNALEERVRNIETHLGIVVVPIDRSLMERVKILEEKILKIEQFYPQIAAHVFNYGRAEVEASSRPGGRVSRMPGTHREEAASRKRRAREGGSEQMAVEEEAEQEALTPPALLSEKEREGEGVGERTEDLSLKDLRSRMEELKRRLLKQAKLSS